jgi:hypothetical protein
MTSNIAATNLVTTRPAETGAGAAAIALLIARAFGMDDPELITALAIVIGFIPAVITGIVELAKKRSAAP